MMGRETEVKLTWRSPPCSRRCPLGRSICRPAECDSPRTSGTWSASVGPTPSGWTYPGCADCSPHTEGSLQQTHIHIWVNVQSNTLIKMKKPAGIPWFVLFCSLQNSTVHYFFIRFFYYFWQQICLCNAFIMFLFFILFLFWQQNYLCNAFIIICCCCIFSTLTWKAVFCLCPRCWSQSSSPSEQ